MQLRQIKSIIPRLVQLSLLVALVGIPNGVASASAPPTGAAMSPAAPQTATWLNEGWTPAHGMCEMDGRDVAQGRAWRCRRSVGGWNLMVKVH